MAQEVPEVVLHIYVDNSRATYLGRPNVDDDYVDTGDGEEVEGLRHSQEQRQAGDPESTIHGASPLSVHKNGGAR